MTKGNFQVEFGHEIRRRRTALGLTLEQLSARSRLTQNYIGNVENGVRDPSLSTILALAKGLGIKPAELFGGGPGLSPAAGEMGLLFEEAPPDIQAAIMALLQAIVKKRRG